MPRRNRRRPGRKHRALPGVDADGGPQPVLASPQRNRGDSAISRTQPGIDCCSTSSHIQPRACVCRTYDNGASPPGGWTQAQPSTCRQLAQAGRPDAVGRVPGDSQSCGHRIGHYAPRSRTCTTVNASTFSTGRRYVRSCGWGREYQGLNGPRFPAPCGRSYARRAIDYGPSCLRRQSRLCNGGAYGRALDLGRRWEALTPCGAGPETLSAGRAARWWTGRV